MSNRIINLIISIIVGIAIIYFIPKETFNKYKIDKISEKKANLLTSNDFIDLNNDGIIEEIETYKNERGHAINIKRNNKLISLENLAKNELKIGEHIYCDYDNNEMKEIYFISAFNKAAYLNILELNEKDGEINRKRIFADSVKIYNNKLDCTNDVIKSINKRYIIFNLTAGFSIQPRNLYMYDLKLDTLIKAPIASVVHNNIVPIQIDTDIFILNKYNYATGNTLSAKEFKKFEKSIHPDSIEFYNKYKYLTKYKYGDFATYTMLFNNKLKYAFKPVERNGWGQLTVSDFIKINKKYNIVSFTFSVMDTTYIPELEIISLKGEIINSIKIPNFKEKITPDPLCVNNETNQILLSDTENDKISIYDNKLELLNQIKIENFEHPHGFEELDGNGSKEFIAFQNNNILIYENNLKNYTRLPIIYKGKNTHITKFGTIKTKNINHFYYNIGDMYYTFKYYKNPKYSLRYLFYALIITACYIFIWIIQRINSRRLEKENKKLEKTIEKRTEDLRNANTLLKEHKAELEIKNKEIVQANEEISAQKDAIEKKNKELEKLSIVASETDNAVMIMDAQGNFEWVNAGFTKLYGNTLEEHKKMYGNNIFDASTNKNIKEIIKKCVKTKKSLIYNSKAIRKDKAEIWLQTTLTPILKSDGKISKFIAIDTDITKIKEVEIEIRNKNKLIQGSINYAKTIQRAILPEVKDINKSFESFVLYQPKDVVSGDFYKYTKVKDYYFIIVADCTGHGVPGAFMSMIGNVLLKEIINEKHILNPAEILHQLDLEINNALRQDKSDNKDGMDVCLVRLKLENDKYEMVFAGAKRPLYIISPQNKFSTIDGTRKSIGGFLKSKNIEFENNKLILEKHTQLYLSTDGFVDQNNKARKRFGTIRLINILQEISYKPLYEQYSILYNTLVDFQDNTMQRDDITILGIKI